MTADPRRAVARTDTLLAEPGVPAAPRRLGRERVKGLVQATQQRIRDGELPAGAAVDAVLAALPPTAGSLRPVLNATGVLVHTNLGRSPLSAAAVAAMAAAGGTTDVELDLATGRRGPRGGGAVGRPPRTARGGGDRRPAGRRPRRGGRDRGEQLRRRPGPRRDRPRPGARAGAGPRRARGDRRRLPHPGPARLDRCPAARGGDDEPGHRRRLPRRAARADGRGAQGAPVELRRPG